MIQPLLGYDEQGNLKIYINPYKPFNEISRAMHERGVPLPRYEDLNESNAMELLRSITEYYQKAESGTLRRGVHRQTESSRSKTPKRVSLRGSTFGDV